MYLYNASFYTRLKWLLEFHKQNEDYCQHDETDVFLC